MKKIFLLSFVVLSGLLQSYAQTINNLPVQKDSIKAMPKENLSEVARDSINEIKLEAMMSYPFIKGSKSAGVLPVRDIEEKQNPDLQYKLIFLISSIDKNNVQKPNEGLNEVARSLNLHVAAGIPVKHITAVVVVFKQGLNILLKDDVFIEKFKSSNPNIALIQELQHAGVKFISCGQSMMRLGIPKETMINGIKVSLSARTAISEYNTMGYVPQ